MEGTKFGSIANRRRNSWIISQKSETFSVQWPFAYAGNKPYLHRKRKSLLVTNINHNLGDSVAEGTVSEPKRHFQHCRIKYYKICNFLKKLQMNKY